MFVAFEIYSAIGSDFINNLQHSCASRVHSLQDTSKYIQKFAETECRHFDNFFITDCTRRQLPMRPVMNISSKWHFRFSAHASWIILTFRADLAHVYITCCGHVYSYTIQYASSMWAYFIWFSPCIPILNFTCHIYIICKQPSFIIATPTGIWGVKWTFIWHFRISMNGNTNFVKSLWYK